MHIPIFVGKSRLNHHDMAGMTPWHHFSRCFPSQNCDVRSWSPPARRQRSGNAHWVSSIPGWWCFVGKLGSQKIDPIYYIYTYILHIYIFIRILYIYIYTYILHIYIYIYSYTIHIYIYLFIYTYTIHIYIYICTYMYTMWGPLDS